MEPLQEIRLGGLVLYMLANALISACAEEEQPQEALQLLQDGPTRISKVQSLIQFFGGKDVVDRVAMPPECPSGKSRADSNASAPCSAMPTVELAGAIATQAKMDYGCLAIRNTFQEEKLKDKSEGVTDDVAKLLPCRLRSNRIRLGKERSRTLTCWRKRMDSSPSKRCLKVL